MVKKRLEDDVGLVVAPLSLFSSNYEDILLSVNSDNGLFSCEYSLFGKDNKHLSKSDVDELSVGEKVQFKGYEPSYVANQMNLPIEVAKEFASAMTEDLIRESGLKLNKSYEIKSIHEGVKDE